MPTIAEINGWKRPLPLTLEVKSRFGFTSDFGLSDKGYTLKFHFIPFFCIYEKDGAHLVQIHGPEWYRQREADFTRFHGITRMEANKDRKKFISATNKQQEMFRELGLIQD